MSTLKRFSIDLELGQTILVGSSRKPAEITKIEYHDKSGDVVINTTQGPRKVLTFSLLEDFETENVADKYR
jgi:hypothetical protein